MSVPKIVPTEKEFGLMADEMASRMGWHVERYEQTRATRITPGLPDRRYVVPNRQRVWVELKRPGGKMTEDQHRWLKTEIEAGGLAIVVDDLAVLAKILRMAATNSSIYRAEARDYCASVVELTAQRGYRKS